MWTKKFWTSALERAIKSTAQAAAALLAGDGMGILEIDWMAIGSVSVLAGVLSVLTSVASAPVGGDKESPSLV